ncbi:hypothetical protein P1X14_19525 [Sphingomonas sp. AOB5]|uniref:hypothetical protein n=1 Tax=Sphingomonas sp. AOB5 TaxID=3034017 RepID=UPI0023F8B838|nr:hypothetical protein [Sphingomonas sp. AOB5]MDF7777457.1 hypothetical protein [Sphingomonas sp. AOB5]
MENLGFPISLALIAAAHLLIAIRRSPLRERLTVFAALILINLVWLVNGWQPMARTSVWIPMAIVALAIGMFGVALAIQTRPAKGSGASV